MIVFKLSEGVCLGTPALETVSMVEANLLSCKPLRKTFARNRESKMDIYLNCEASYNV